MRYAQLRCRQDTWQRTGSSADVGFNEENSKGRNSDRSAKDSSAFVHPMKEMTELKKVNRNSVKSVKQESTVTTD